MRFQDKVKLFTIDTFGINLALNVKERCNRFAEESIELLQSSEYSKEDMLNMVEYVYSREVGEKKQEVGGVMVTLAALCNALNIDLIKQAGREIRRAIRNSLYIRVKHNGKPDGVAIKVDNTEDN